MWYIKILCFQVLNTKNEYVYSFLCWQILNTHADILYKSSSKSNEVKEEVKAEELEIEDELSKEVADMKKEYAAPVAERRFQNVISNVKCCLYIRTTVSLITTVLIPFSPFFNNSFNWFLVGESFWTSGFYFWWY